jgi:hypothetical protein
MSRHLLVRPLPMKSCVFWPKCAAKEAGDLLSPRKVRPV